MYIYLFIQILNKKKRLQRFFKEAIEEKKRVKLQLKHNEDLEDRALEAYREAKYRIRKIQKSLSLKEREEKARRAQIIGLMTFSHKDKLCIFRI